MGEPAPLVLTSGRTVPLKVRRNARARRFVLRVSAGVIHMTIPTHAGLEEAQGWAREQTRFIERELKNEGTPVPFAFGVQLPILGKTVEMVPGLKISGALNGDHLEMAPTKPEILAQRVETFLRGLALREAETMLRVFWGKLGVPDAPVSVRNYKRRWGSCSAEGDTIIHWRLVFAPLPVFEAVCAHEAAHRIELNHSPAFYRVLDGLLPNRSEAELWLKEHGPSLWAYGREPHK